MPTPEVTSNILWPYLKIHPRAGISVKIDNWLVPVTGVHFDNEFGLIVLELDDNGDSDTERQRHDNRETFDEGRARPTPPE